MQFKKHNDKTFLTIRLCVAEDESPARVVEAADAWEPLGNGEHWKIRGASITQCPTDSHRIHVVLDY